MATATWNGMTIAQSDDTVMVEGNHYFPVESLASEFFEESRTTTVCGWKGTANYYTLNVDGHRTSMPPGTTPIPNRKPPTSKGTWRFGKGWR